MFTKYLLLTFVTLFLPYLTIQPTLVAADTPFVTMIVIQDDENKVVPVEETPKSDPIITADNREVQEELSHLKVALLSAVVTLSTATVAYGVRYIISHYLS
jgi:hypothetical protein